MVIMITIPCDDPPDEPHHLADGSSVGMAQERRQSVSRQRHHLPSEHDERDDEKAMQLSHPAEPDEDEVQEDTADEKALVRLERQRLENGSELE